MLKTWTTFSAALIFQFLSLTLHTFKKIVPFSQKSVSEKIKKKCERPEQYTDQSTPRTEQLAERK